MRLMVARDGVEELWTLELDDGGRSLTLRSTGAEEWRVTGASLWESFRALRRRVEPLGFRLCCNGARTNARASRMGVEMGGGGGVYLLSMGRPVRHRRQLVDALAYAPASEVSTLAEQDEFYERWLRSLG